MEREHSGRATTRLPLDVDADSREWLTARAARFKVTRRRPMLPHVGPDELGDIAAEAADDALMSVLGRLDQFRGASHFSTWAYKFAVLEAAVKSRRRAYVSPASTANRGRSPMPNPGCPQ